MAKAVAEALANKAAYAGKIFDLAGPQILTMRELNEWIASSTGHDPLFIDVPDFAAKTMAIATGWLPGAPITADQFKMLGYDNIADESRNGLSIMGIAPTPLDTVAHDWLDIYRKHGRFAQANTAKSAA